jgi:dipeptidyl aminopeptidase/acylaminoacyl peptidase
MRYKRQFAKSLGQFLVLSVAFATAFAAGRPMTPADLLARQLIDGVALSPDGHWAAVVVVRPKKPGELYARGYIGGAERADVWLVPTNGGPPINVTRGERDHAGYWEPIWSPDGKRLAMMSTNGGDNVRCYIYDFVKRRLSRLTNNGVDMALGIESEQRTVIPNRWFGGKPSSMRWLDPTHILLGVLPVGVRPQPFDELERTSQMVAEGLATVKRGGITANVLTSGEVGGVEPPTSEVALTVIDTETGSSRVITKLPLAEIRLSKRLVSISPTRQYAAIMATYPSYGVRAPRQLSYSDPRFLRLGVIEFKERQNIHWLDNVKPVAFGLSGTATPIRWAASGSAFAAIGVLAGAGSVEARAFTVSFGEGKAPAAKILARAVNPDGSERVFVADDIQWANNDDLLVYAYPVARADVHSANVARGVRGFGLDNTVDSARRDWWIVSSDGSSRILTGEMAQTPRRLWPMRRTGVMLGNAGGKLWTIDVLQGKVNPLEVSPNIATTAILRPANDEALNTAVDNLLISSPSDAGVDLYRVNLSDNRIDLHRVAEMPKGASYRDYSERAGVVAYETPDTKISVLREGRETPITLLSLNRHMDSIKPQYRSFEYQSTDGTTLRGELLLPYGYVSGQRYPLVVIVYAGSVPQRGDWASPYRSSAYPEPLLIAGRGYAVLVPSMPLQPMGVGSDPMLDLDKGVKPAIEKVVEMGIADADRVGVIGHSYGGYSVYGLVTQTQRFRAAVAFAGVSDLVSMWGRLDSRYRFSSAVNSLSAPATAEAQQMRMGVPPWEDPERYLRNSPFFHADQVTTPILMIHGDVDSISITQAEQFFVAMNRLNKRSKLVRYLGEGHGIDSPQNILDFWQQVFSWFDEFLMNPRNEKTQGDGKKTETLSPGKH